MGFSLIFGYWFFMRFYARLCIFTLIYALPLKYNNKAV
nr:MAG TPA: hypothetical protein [Bacteriophage sp.]